MLQMLFPAWRVHQRALKRLVTVFDLYRTGLLCDLLRDQEIQTREQCTYQQHTHIHQQRSISAVQASGRRGGRCRGLHDSVMRCVDQFNVLKQCIRHGVERLVAGIENQKIGDGIQGIPIREYYVLVALVCSWRIGDRTSPICRYCVADRIVRNECQNIGACV